MEKMMQNKKVIKIICIVLASILWFYVSYQENPSMTKTVRNVPITITGQQELKENGFSVYSVSESDVDVKATAKRLSLARINNKTLSATVNVASIKSPGKYVIPASIASSLSSGGSFFAKGNGITVVIEPILKKTWNIELNMSDPSDPSVRRKSEKMSENTVTLSAPESIMEKVGTVRTETVIPGNTGSSQTVRLIVLSKDNKILEGVECEPSKITVSYSLHNVEKFPIILKTTDHRSIRLPDEYYVELYGSGSDFDKLKSIETQPFDLSNYLLNDKGSQVTIMLKIPEFASINSGSPNVTLVIDDNILNPT